MKSIVVYYSRPDENYGVGEVEVGNTELLAKEIIKQTGADEFKIEPKVPYPKNYMDCVNQATEELKNNARPEYLGDVDLKDYDIIYLGYPIWWGDLPMVCYTFLENHDFTGKTIIPFNIHEGSGNSGTYAKLQSKFPAATFKGDGFEMTGHEARTPEGIAKLNAWLKTL